MAPRKWQKPLTLMYGHNYRYGTSLYSGAISDIERRHLRSVSHLGHSRRCESIISSFAPSSTVSSYSPVSIFVSKPWLSHRSPRLASLLGSSLSRVTSSPYTPSYYSYYDLPSYRPRSSLASEYLDLEDKSLTRRRRRRRFTDDYSPDFGSTFNLYWDRPWYTSDYSYITDKCHELKGNLDVVRHRVREAESKLKSDTVGSSSSTKLGDLGLEVRGSFNAELHQVIKRQARQIAEMQNMYDELDRQVTLTNEDLRKSQRRCHGLQAELDSVRRSLDHITFV